MLLLGRRKIWINVSPLCTLRVHGEKEAKVSSDFHVRFDNAYYSVDKAYKHQKVSIKASTAVVKIYSQKGVLIGEHQRATHKGQWCTNTEHLPKDYNDYREWNAEYFIRRATTVGNSTVCTSILYHWYLINFFMVWQTVLWYTKKKRRWF